MCATDGCSKWGDRRMWGLCSKCYRIRYSLAMDPAEYLQGVAGACQIPGCPATGSLQLDHDNFCCKSIPSGGRCGACNRGFLCRSHNVAVGRIEHIDGFEKLIGTPSESLVTYLLSWREHPRQKIGQERPANHSNEYLAKRGQQILNSLGVFDEDLHGPARDDEPDWDDPDVMIDYALMSNHA